MRATPLTEAAGAYSSGNQVLDALPARDRVDLDTDIELLSVRPPLVAHEVGATLQYVAFPIDCVLSVVATLDNGDTVEVGTVGSESFVESDAALNARFSQSTSFCQVRGNVGRMSIARFTERMEASASFARLMRRNVRATLFNAQQFAACNAKHSVMQRCARWLAMTADRVGGPNFTLTHDVLSTMLGVRRSGVSQAAEALHAMGAIAYRRGAVSVLDHELLTSVACECYEACKVAFEESLLDDRPLAV
jgi:CRP-like cAMP-binding protein